MFFLFPKFRQQKWGKTLTSPLLVLFLALFVIVTNHLLSAMRWGIVGSMARLKLKRVQKDRYARARGGSRLKEKTNVKGSFFLPDHEQQIRMIAMKGATDDEIADIFGVSRIAFQKWRKLYPTFEKALDEGRTVVDADVVFKLYTQTQGFYYTEETAAGKDADVVEVRRYSKPDTAAMKYWLECRQPERWSSRTVITGGRKDGKELPVGVKVETRNEIIDSILSLIHPKADGTNGPSIAK